MEMLIYNNQLILLPVLSTQRGSNKSMFSKLLSLFKGENEEVHKRKGKYVVDMTKIHAKAREQVKSSQELVIMIENSTAFKIAKATGRMKK